MFMTDEQSSELSQPCICSFNLPAFTVAPQGSPVLSRLAYSVCFVGHDQLDTPFLQALPQRIAIIGFVGNQPLRFLPRTATALAVGDADRGKRDFCKFDFRRGGRSQVLSQRNTLAIDHHQPLCTVAPLGLSDASAPFFADAKLPSIKTSLQSSSPFLFNSPRKARQIFNQTPRSSQSRKRRQHVAGEGYSAGRSCRLAPLRAIHKMPSSTRRLSAQGRPPRLLLRNLGNKGSILFHCPSVSIGPPRGMSDSSCHLIAYFKPSLQVPPSIPNQLMKQLLEIQHGSADSNPDPSSWI